MLLVDTYLERSPISGIGVFCRQPVSAGTVLWAPHHSVDLRFSPAEWERWLAELSEPVRADMRRHSYKQGGLIWLCLDNARFMNHGGSTSNVLNDASNDTMYAGCDIPADSELLCDYQAYSDPDDLHLASIAATFEMSSS